MTITIGKSSEFTALLQESLMSRYNNQKREDDTAHVSDLLPTTCIRKQYYQRKFPEMCLPSSEMVHHFIRGESSEFIITQLAKMGVAQANIEMDGITGHPDIISNGGDTVVELKDTISGKRLSFHDDIFRSYLRQLLYYLVMTEIEKGIISIRYNIKELNWIKRDSEGDYFFRPHNAKDVGIESWKISLPKNDIAREILKNEMVRRKNLFLKVLKNSDASIVPRLPEKMRKKKCSHCPFYERCMNQDQESEEARKMVNEIDLLDVGGIVHLSSP